MRRLNQIGFTMVELCITVSVLAMMLVMALPALSDYSVNARLREGSNLVVSTALFARSEAIKRNATVRLGVSVSGSSSTLTVNVVDSTGVTLLRSRTLPDAVSLSAFSADFSSAGILTPFGASATTAVISLTRNCGSDIRCPGVRIEAGGAVSQCTAGACS